MAENRVVDVWGSRTPYGRDTEWPVRVDQELSIPEDEVDRWVQSACVLCSNGCACDIAVKDGRMVGVRGRAGDRINHGRLGPKGLYASWQWSDQDRLTRPLARVNGELAETTWDAAMERIVAESKKRHPLQHGFYTSGQLFLEEYYTLAVIGKAGLGTPHMDGNTRLCTATAGQSLKETFGSDGQPGSYNDIEVCDALFLFGHNMAATQTVLWARVLDRVEGTDPPAIVAVDPRWTPVAEVARRTGGVHLAPLPGTNQSLMNGLVHELIANGWIDKHWVDEHTLGYDELAQTVAPYTPEKVAEICDIPAADVRRAAEIFGTSERVLSTVLQGFYQSHQATAASCQVNNLHLLRGMIGQPGCGLLQMNGQPTAENTRECGADGDLPGFRNWANPNHVEELAKLWNVDPSVIPHWAPPTHAMQLWRYVEQGSIDFLWISATNPAVSLPELSRIRDILSKEDLFLVVQDGFLTETAQYADVVLPAALWGEKQGTFTNASRTVHLSEQAVAPPGEARSDLEIFIDYAERMDFRDKDGHGLIAWKTPEEAFDAWKDCSRGRPCDYSGLTYDALREGSGIPWPCTEDVPAGTDRLYSDSVFPTDPEDCEDYGHDLTTGGSTTPEKYKAQQPGGRAFLKAAEFTSPAETPSADYPMIGTTGRSPYHFHTRTKTGRSRRLRAAEPRMWVELSPADAELLEVTAGERVIVESERGRVEAECRVGTPRTGVVFLPFHFGYWDNQDGPPTAANEVTITEWDPVSKQPMYKVAAVRVRKVES
jgi:ferredoxin-nitrate reductase